MTSRSASMRVFLIFDEAFSELVGILTFNGHGSKGSNIAAAAQAL